jgi:hypothetical protein
VNQGSVLNAEPFLRFVPSRVEGLPGVSEVVVRPDRLELRSDGRWVVLPFDAMARWPRPVQLWRLLSRLGWRPRWLPVGDRDWFHPPRDRFFRFYTDPPLTVFLADEDRGIGYGDTLFRRVQEVIASGGFNTYDLG